ncbi:NADH dehydrogenase [ubiquinone] 1 alpha subcomplex subunit 9, mitochondrial-like [Paramacrobiotus metropolitanus]|uniref:NADH dehydrogenase [ubiquinone] 1 alpha subcomplex subunit 9, mitochondrial-like n=1 Tax=Paramacrobiotus metropolitanus TaxID=2943436 RepID=UPI002446151F|nr:NADH dehydrogenase [ubiquinone] 1 alpha subcomplex subunit 9, mitochondrial-like [Paramacrobiotus metropolitanus]
MKAARGLELWRGIYGVKATSPLLAVTCRNDTSKRFQHPHNPAQGQSGDIGVVPDIPTSAKSSTLGNLKRGRGGRSSFSGVVATVFGASGFLGGAVSNQLGKIGSQLIIAHRCDPYDVRHIKVMGDLGQVLFQYCDIRDEAAVKRSMKYSNVVINLIGRDYETKNFTFEQVHVEGARRIARAAKEAGVERLIHFSALNASENPTPILMKKGSEFLKSKARGEKAVLEEFPNATIFRPADIFGTNDRFIMYYRYWLRRNVKWMPMYKWGEATIKQPVFVGDVARAVANAVTDPDSIGKIYEAVGPRRYVLADLVDWFYQVMRRSPEMWGYRRTPLDPISRLKHKMFDIFAYRNPHLTTERAEREYVTDKRAGTLPDLEALGIKPLKTIEEYAPFVLYPFRAFNDYNDELGEFPTPPDPRYMEDELHTELWKLYHQSPEQQLQTR